MASNRTVARPAPAKRPLILHITGDYPDGVREPTTLAIKQLIDGATSADHVIFSLKRLADPRAAYLKECPAPTGQRLFALGHFGLPFGVGLDASFAQVASRIAAALDERDLRPDIVHSHRLTFDGLAGDRLAARFNADHIVSVRGEVESKVFRFKPTYRARLAGIVERAARIYFVSAWFAPDLARHTGYDPTKACNLPNIVANARASIAGQPADDAFVTAANLDIYLKKGIDRLLAAFAAARPMLGETRLDIFGGGTAASTKRVAALISRHRLDDRVRLRGRVDNSEFLAQLPRYLALVMPSRNETFGMVYTEALFAGVPILYSKRTGIDGYLDGLDVGRAVDANAITEISHALIALKRHNHGLRDRIVAAAPDLMARFGPQATLERYVNDIAALHSRRQPVYDVETNSN